MQWLFWYDKPSDFHDEPELEFFRQLPTVWDQTKVIDGKIGEFASVARQKGDDWYIGTINNRQSRELKLPLAFLARGTKYVAHIYSDDDNAKTATKVGIEKRPVDAATILTVNLKAAGGQAIWIEAQK